MQYIRSYIVYTDQVPFVFFESIVVNTQTNPATINYSAMNFQQVPSVVAGINKYYRGLARTYSVISFQFRPQNITNQSCIIYIEGLSSLSAVIGASVMIIDQTQFSFIKIIQEDKFNLVFLPKNSQILQYEETRQFSPEIINHVRKGKGTNKVTVLLKGWKVDRYQSPQNRFTLRIEAITIDEYSYKIQISSHTMSQTVIDVYFTILEYIQDATSIYNISPFSDWQYEAVNSSSCLLNPSFINRNVPAGFNTPQISNMRTYSSTYGKFLASINLFDLSSMSILQIASISLAQFKFQPPGQLSYAYQTGGSAICYGVASSAMFFYKKECLQANQTIYGNTCIPDCIHVDEQQPSLCLDCFDQEYFISEKKICQLFKPTNEYYCESEKTYSLCKLCGLVLFDCLECNSSQGCLRCQINFYLFNGQCYQQQPNGTYCEDQICQKCLNQSCKTCTSSECLSCYANFDLIGHTCTKSDQTNGNPTDPESPPDAKTENKTSNARSIVSNTANVVLVLSAFPSSNNNQCLVTLQKVNLVIWINVVYSQDLVLFLNSIKGTNPLKYLQEINVFKYFLVKDQDSTNDEFESNILVNGGVFVIVFLVMVIQLLLYIISLKSGQHKWLGVYQKISCHLIYQLNGFIMIVSGIIIFSQIMGFMKENYKYIKVIFLLVLLMYESVLLMYYANILRSNTSQMDNMDISTADYSFKRLMFKLLLQDHIESNRFTRNFVLTYTLIENILIPFSILVFFDDCRIQSALCLILQVSLCTLSIMFRPSKSILNNFRLILDQICWTFSFAILLIYSYKLNESFTNALNLSLMILLTTTLFLHPTIQTLNLLIYLYQIITSKKKKPSLLITYPSIKIFNFKKTVKMHEFLNYHLKRKVIYKY